MQTSKIEIEVDAAGKGKLVLDGRDMSDVVVGFAVKAKIGQPTIVEIELCGVQSFLNVEADDDKITLKKLTRV